MDDNDDDSPPPPQSPPSGSSPPGKSPRAVTFKIKISTKHKQSGNASTVRQKVKAANGRAGAPPLKMPGTKTYLGKMAPMSTPDAVSAFISTFSQTAQYRELDALDRAFNCRAIEDALRDSAHRLVATIRASHQADVREALAYREVALKAVRLLLDAVAHFVRYQLPKIQQAKKEKEGRAAGSDGSGSGSGAPEAPKEPGGPSAASVLPSRSKNGGAGASKESIYHSLTDLSKDGGGGSGSAS